jgi:hypothetical protein
VARMGWIPARSAIGTMALIVVAGVGDSGATTEDPTRVDVVGARQDMDHLRMLTHHIGLEAFHQLVGVLIRDPWSFQVGCWAKSRLAQASPQL